jgi:hypothetical protein
VSLPYFWLVDTLRIFANDRFAQFLLEMGELTPDIFSNPILDEIVSHIIVLVAERSTQRILN